ncbi:MAG: EscU/YscU/HrcU family type III secretion system export apparatus switch protein, partial [Planctomycetales bacterium]|nr:EscU/YscU/HrcU family type III secretion system export apparatus switch protein [Planctomycetales bacterium]
WSITHTILLTRQLLSRAVSLVFPLTLVMGLCAFGINTLQIGFRLSWEPLAPNWSRLDLAKGFSKLASTRSALRGIMLLLKVSTGLGIAIWFLYRNRHDVHDLGLNGLARVISQTWRFSLLTCFCLAGMLLAIGLTDYLYQRWQFEQDLMMSKQEVKEEQKREDGDPLMKGRMRRFARESIKQQMLQKVPEATVVLTNPTHIAVAIKYDRDTMLAPRVIAKGTDRFAKRIAQVARQNGVPVLERKPLARALYASVEVDQEIPPNLYRAMAEILAYIYGLKDAA